MAIFADFGVGRKFYSSKYVHIPAVKISARLELDKNISSPDGH
jgi:hypothetical protein